MTDNHHKTTSSSNRRRKSTTKSSSSSSRRRSSTSSSNNNLVYIPDDTYAWLPAKICSMEETGEAQVEVLPLDEEDTILTSSIIKGKKTVALPLPPQNRPGAHYRDMADLRHLHEAAILYNLKERHYQQKPYTRVGDIVVAMNPFEWLPDLYTPETRNWYANLLVFNNEQQQQQQSLENDDEDPLNSSEYEKLGHDPHVYETSCLAYKGMWHDGQHQTILVTGESGAGKTETVKIVMTHLATIQQQQPSEDTTTTTTLPPDQDIMKRVLQSNPILEAFGNAQTLRNDNSSRFGKLTELQFDWSSPSSSSSRSSPPPPLAGSICTTYLLEKSRVVGQSQGERNYHVFYQLVSCDNNNNNRELKEWVWKELIQEDVSFACLNYDSDKKDEDDLAHDWTQTLEALEVFGFTGERLRTLLRALCCVLQLSNIQFDEESLPDNPELEGPTVITSRDELNKLEDILGIDPLFLQEAMTKRSMKVGGTDVVKKQLSPSVAKECCNALAKEIYARLFSVLVSSINEKTKGKQQRHHHHRHRRRRKKSKKEKRRDSMGSTLTSSSEMSSSGKPRRRGSNESSGSSGASSVGTSGNSNTNNFGVICLLDIFGFERFDVNRFEQLCINYANEHLQNKYVVDNFGRIQREYEAEGIELFDFRLVDNSPILQVLEHKLSGVLTALHEECVRPKGNDESFVYKIKVVHSTSSILVKEKLHRKTEFGIQHFAGLVTYDATDFVERNTDQLPTDLMECVAQHSTNDLIRSEFATLLQQQQEQQQQQAASIKKKQNHRTTVLQTFRVQLQELMTRLAPTHTRYIRCIKPNPDRVPQKTEHTSTMRQLECAGLVTAITISRETYPNQLDYGTCQYRFECLLLLRRRSAVAVSPIVVQTYQALTTKQQSVQASSSDLVTGSTSSEEFKNARKETVRFLLSNLVPPDIVRRNSISAVHHKPHHHKKKKKDPFACGNTKVYFRAGVLEYLENERLEYYTERVIQIQSWFRCLMTTAWYQHLTTVVVRVQSYARRQLAVARRRRWKRMAYRVYGALRRYQAQRLLQTLRETRAAVRLQSWFRGSHCQRLYQNIPLAVRTLQRAYRHYRWRQHQQEVWQRNVEEARMDEKLLSLHAQVNKSILHLNNNHSNSGMDSAANSDYSGPTTTSSHRSSPEKSSSSNSKPRSSSHHRATVNEEMLQDVEHMFEYLRDEMAVLRTTNTQLHDEVQSKDASLQEWKGRTEAAEAAAVAHSLTVTQLTKQNAQYEHETTEHRQVVLDLKKQLRQSASSQEDSLKALRTDFQRVIDQKDDQMESLRNRYTKAVKMHQKDLAILTAQHRAAEEELLQENMRLKEELKRTQESHHEYLAKLMDVLETTHQTREEETAKISLELATVKKEKDATIAQLQGEIANLKQSILTTHHAESNSARSHTTSSSSRTPTNNHHPPLSPKPKNTTTNSTPTDSHTDNNDNDKQQNISQVSALKVTMERNAEARSQRNQKFQEISTRLRKAVGSSDPLIHLVTTNRSAQVDEETKRYNKMISYLDELYHLEERSQHELNDDVLEMMDNYLLHCQPNVAMKQLQDGYQKIHQENAMLKQQALSQGHCPRCEARDKRRMAGKKSGSTMQETTTPPSRAMRAPSPARSSTPSRAATMRRRRSLSISRKKNPELDQTGSRTPPPGRLLPPTSETTTKRGRDRQPAPLLPPGSSTTASSTTLTSSTTNTPVAKEKEKKKARKKEKASRRDSAKSSSRRDSMGRDSAKSSSHKAAASSPNDKPPSVKRRDSIGNKFAKTMGFGGNKNNNSPPASATSSSSAPRNTKKQQPQQEVLETNSSTGSRSSRLRGRLRS